MDADTVLAKLADAAGIENHYWDLHGTQHVTSTEATRGLLAAFGVAAGTDQEAWDSLARLGEAPWRCAVPPVLVVRDGEAVAIPLRLAEGTGTIRWTLKLESGDVTSGEARGDDLPADESAEIGGRRVVLRRLTLEALPLGYHSFRLDGGEAVTRLIVTPRRAYLPPRLSIRRAWGMMLQLYSLKSHRDWGIGDFSVLKILIDRVAAADGDAIGLNPLHTLFLDQPEDASPYSPCSRLFRNPLYLDITAIPDFTECEEARALAESFRRQVDAARDGEFVRYREVAALKLPMLQLLHDSFVARHLSNGSDRAGTFRSFVGRGGADLDGLALFQSLTENFGTHDWTRWPHDFRDRDPAALDAWRAAHGERISFHQYLQWQCEEQFAAAAEQAKARGMAVGLYNDLAVSVDAASADHWSHQKLFAGGARVGAPPDPFNEKGQDWGVVPINPLRLVETGFDHFTALLRANMRHAGALRIDHVMGWQRLFLIPPGMKATEGAYVRYPLSEMVAIAALESQRNRCLVIGEDLGTVPAGFRERMADAGILSSRVLYFERQHEGFKAPGDYPGLAAVSVSTHDLATLAGFWQGEDLAAKARLGLFKSGEEESAAWSTRMNDRRQLLSALAAEHLLPQGVPQHEPDRVDWTAELTQAVHAYLARSVSTLMMVQMDDLVGQTHQANLPGSITEYPNWRRRMAQALEDLGADPRFQAAMAAIAAGRT